MDDVRGPFPSWNTYCTKIPLVKNNQPTKVYVFEQSRVELNTLEGSDKGGVTHRRAEGRWGLPGPGDLEGMGKVHFPSRDHCKHTWKAGQGQA